MTVRHYIATEKTPFDVGTEAVVIGYRANTDFNNLNSNAMFDGFINGKSDIISETRFICFLSDFEILENRHLLIEKA